MIHIKVRAKKIGFISVISPKVFSLFQYNHRKVVVNVSILEKHILVNYVVLMSAR